MMNRDTVAGEWLFSGIRDLLFAFSIEDQHDFYRYSVFHQIMALEKILKGGLLFVEAEVFLLESDQEVLHEADKITRRWGHDLRQLLRLSDDAFSPWSSAVVLTKTFAGLTGEQLIEACRAGYQETRYPTPSPVSLRFPTREPGLCQDPLNSTSTRDCIHELCQDVLAQVKLRGGIGGLQLRVERLLASDLGKRFGRLFFAGREREFL